MSQEKTEPKNKYEIGEIVFDITKLNKMLTKPGISDGKVIVPEYDKDGKKSPERYVVVNVTPLKVNNEAYSITPFDICILDTIYSMIHNDIKTFTIEELANRLVKREVKFDSTKMQIPPLFFQEARIPSLSPENNTEISVEELNFYNYLHFCVSKLARIDVMIDYTHFKRPCDVEPGEEYVQYKRNIVYGRLLPLKGHISQTVAMKKEKVHYIVEEIPILFEYAIQCKRLARGPAKLMATPLRATPENITLQNAVARRIIQIKNKNNHSASNRISYEWGKNNEKGLLTRIGVKREHFSSDANWSKKKGKIHKAVGQILEKYKADNIIKDYHEVKNGQVNVGYDIEV